MTIDRKVHDLKNAMLFLETFPEILEQVLGKEAISQSEDLRELLEIHRDKIGVVKETLDP